MIVDGPRAARNALHGVNDMLVEPWKEPKAMFAREVATALRVRHRDTARLAAWQGFQLVHLHRKATLNQLVGSAHPRHPTAQNNHRFGHCQLPRAASHCASAASQARACCTSGVSSLVNPSSM